MGNSVIRRKPMKNMKYTQNAFEPKQNSNNRKKEKK